MRAILAFILMVAAVAAAALFADHPGQVRVVWQGWLIETSVGVLLSAIALIALTLALLVLLVAGLRRLPRNLRRRRAARRQRAGERALTRGLVALAAGQAAEARRAAQRAGDLVEASPVALLLAAEAAQREGDTAAAHGAYTLLLQRPESEFLGLRGLIGQALRAGDDVTARHLAERARRLRPDAPWLVDSLLVLHGRAGDWAAARDTLTGAARRGALPAEQARHHQGVVLYELSRAAERGGDRRRAAGFAAKAQALAPDLAAPACQHARLLFELGRRRAAAKAIERAWRRAPHPDLARLYLDLRPEAAPLARAIALQHLAAQNPEAVESHLAIAEAALAAQLWGEARRHLGLAATAPPASRRLCLLMARLEESDAGDMAAARGWLARAVTAPPDPAYVCRRCGGESSQWMALCPECGGFDTLGWRTPPYGSGPSIAAPIAVGAAPMLPAPDGAGDPPRRRAPSNGLASTAQSDN